MDKKCYSNLK